MCWAFFMASLRSLQLEDRAIRCYSVAYAYGVSTTTLPASWQVALAGLVVLDQRSTELKEQRFFRSKQKESIQDINKDRGMAT